MKEKYDNNQFLKHLPHELRDFLEHIQSLGYYEKPDYNKLQGLLQQCMMRKAIRDNDPFDWEKAMNDNTMTCNTSTANAAVKETKVPG